jgi:hypothetical protein
MKITYSLECRIEETCVLLIDYPNRLQHGDFIAIRTSTSSNWTRDMSILLTRLIPSSLSRYGRSGSNDW